MKKELVDRNWQHKLRTFRFAEKLSGKRPILQVVTLFITVLVLATMAIATQAATVARTNSEAGSADFSALERSVTFSDGDFVANSRITNVKVAVTFEKLDGACPNHGGGWPFNREIYAFLTSPLGTKVVLIEDNANSGGSGAGYTYTSSEVYGGQVTVQFDDTAGADVGGPAPASGAFRPVQPLAAFNGQSPLGQWTLTIGDSGFSDPLCFYEYTLTIEADQPPAVEDQSFAVAENSPNGTVVGTVVASDPDSGDKLTYSITAGNDDGIFAINSNTGAIAVADGSQLDFETTASYNLTVSVVDSSLLSDTATITINVTDANDAPADISLSANSVAENQPTGTAVGIFTTTDVDAGDSHAYSLVTGAGADDNNVFTIDGDTLKTNAIFDFETKASYNIRVRTTDAGGATFEKSFTITISDTNDAPTVANPIPDQNATEDAPFTFTFAADTFADQDGDALSYAAQLSGSDPLPAWLSFDAATRTFGGTPANADVGTIAIEVIATDPGAASVSSTFNLTVINSNDAPTGIALSPGSVAENRPTGTAVGTFTTTDPDVGDSHTYSLVAGAGDDDNTSFAIDGSTLRTNAIFDFETKDTYTIRVRTTDAEGATFEKAFTITIADANDAPTVANTIPDQSASEGVLFSFTFAAATFDDVDPGDTLTYAAALANGDPLPAWLSFDAATRAFGGTPANDDVGTISIRVTATDSGAASAHDTFNLTVLNTNDAPADISLSANSVAENQPAGTAVGNFTTSDVDVGDSHTYSLAAGVGDTDNAAFTIDGDQLKTAAVFDFETKASYTIRVRTTDAGGATFEKAFTITIADSNDAPADIALSPSSVAENETAGTAVGAFTTSDPDVGDSHTYSLAAGDGDDDNAAFIIDGDQLKTAAVFDFETKNTYTIRVQSDDGNGGTFAKAFTITIADANDAPTVVNPIPDQTATEDTPFTFTVAANTFADQDGDTLSYAAQLSGGGALPAWLSFDAGTRTFSGTPANDDVGVISIRVTATDTNAASVSATFDLTVLNTNDAPEDVGLNPSSVAENEPVGTVVGSFTTTDPDVGDSHSYTLVAGLGDDDNSSFTIDGSTLRTNAVFDFETKASYTIRARTTDSGGATFEKSFTITIIDANDAPVANDSSGATDEDTVLAVPPSGVLSNDSDADDGDNLTVTGFDTASARGATVSVQPNGSYTYDPRAATALQVLQVGQSVVDTFTYTIGDSGGLGDSAVVRITVSGVNDAPLAVDDAAATKPATAVTIDVLENDTDLENDVLTISLVTQGSHGAAINNGDGTVTYTPNAGFDGVDTFTYTIGDGHGGSDSATVTVSVAEHQLFLPLVVNHVVIAPDLVVTSVRAGSQDVEVVIKNQGNAAVNDAFWVDFYVDPDPVPSGANQLWQDVSAQGVVWGVTAPLAPGQTLILTYSPAPGAPNLYYSAEHSSFSSALPAGTPIYAQVDSAHLNTLHGGVLESHEVAGGPYNNVSSRATAGNFSLRDP